MANNPSPQDGNNPSPQLVNGILFVLYDLLKEELLRVIKEPKVVHELLGALNETFIVLIPKQNYP